MSIIVGIVIFLGFFLAIILAGYYLNKNHITPKEYYLYHKKAKEDSK